MRLLSCNKCEDCLLPNCGTCSACVNVKSGKRWDTIFNAGICPFLRCRNRVCKSKVPSSGKKGKTQTFMDLEDEVLPLPVSQQLVSVAPPSATNCSEVEPHQGLTLQVLQLGVSNAPPTDGSPVASTSMPPLSSKSGATAPLGKRSSKKSVQAASGDGPKKQKLQLEREELLRIEKNFVKKVPSSVGLAGYMYSCGKCEKSFRIRLRCLDHARNCGEQNTTKKRKRSQRKLVCNVCNQVAYTRAQLQKHRKIEHSNLIRRHKCTRCQKVFPSSQSFCRHVKHHFSSATFACPVAGPGLPVPNRSDMFRWPPHIGPKNQKSSPRKDIRHKF